jgi:hypothetical protein
MIYLVDLFEDAVQEGCHGCCRYHDSREGLPLGSVLVEEEPVRVPILQIA